MQKCILGKPFLSITLESMSIFPGICFHQAVGPTQARTLHVASFISSLLLLSRKMSSRIHTILVGYTTIVSPSRYGEPLHCLVQFVCSLQLQDFVQVVAGYNFVAPFKIL